MCALKLTPYSKLLALTKEGVDKLLAPVRSRSARKKAEYEVAKLEESLATFEKDITELCSKQEINFGAILDKLDEYDLAERRVRQFNKVIEELFPDA